MSGFELDRQQTLSKLSDQTELLTQDTSEDVNKGLLSQLQQSSDITKDLAALYSDRPYVYARVMQQLSRVLGKTKVRSIHQSVISKAQELSDRAASAAKSAMNGLKSETNGSTTTNNNNNGSDDFEAKEVTLNIPLLGITNKKVEVSKENGDFTVSTSDFDSPFIETVSATGHALKGDMDYIKLKAGIKAKFLNEKDKNTAEITVRHKDGKFTPEGSLAASLDIPGLDDLTADFTFDGENSSMTATFSGEATLFNKSLGATSDINATLTGEGATINGTLTVHNATGGGETAAAAAPAVQSAGADAGAAQSNGPMQFSGTINVAAEGETVTGISGNIQLSNLAFLANPEETVELDVSHDGNDFSAALGGSVSFAEYTLPDGKTKVGLTVNSASYSSADNMCGDCTVTAQIGDLLTATGNIEFANNQLVGGTLDIDVPDIAIPKENSFLTGSLRGTASFDSEGFTGASCEGDISLSIANSTCALVLESLELSPAGVVTGHVSQAEENEFKVGCLTASGFTADISSECDTFIESASGKITLDHQYIKSDENGIPISFENGVLGAHGTLNISKGEEDQLGTCVFTAEFAGDAVSAEGTLTLDKDYQVAGSKLQLCKDATATLTVNDNEVEPLKFSGDYKYGYTTGGEGGEGGAGEAPAAEGGESEGGNKQLLISGTLSDCTLDLQSGNLSGSATADLDADIVIAIPGGKGTVTICDSMRKRETALQIEFSDSRLTSVSGSVAVEGNLNFQNGVLDVEGYILDFNYDVNASAFTGVVDAGLKKQYKISDAVTLEGRKETGVKVTVEQNNVTDIELDVGLKMTAQSTMFKGGKGVFDGDMKNAHIDVNSFALNAPSITVRPYDDVVLTMHDGNSELTLSKDTACLETAIENNLPTFLSGDIKYEGWTKLLDPEKTRQLNVEGDVDFRIENVMEAADMTGTLGIKVTEDYILDSIPDVDEIDLMEGTNVKVDISNTGVDDVSGDIMIRYIYEKTERLPQGFKMELKGTDMHYNVPTAMFDGHVSITGAEDTVVSLGENKTFTLKGPGTGLEADIVQSKLTGLTGSVAFEAHLGIGGEGSEQAIDITDGTATIAINVDKENIDISTLDVKANATCDFNMGENLRLYTEDPCSFESSIDLEGIKTATFKGGLHVETQVGVEKNTVDFVIAAEGDGMQYERGAGINGKISVTCDKETKLGSATHGAKTFSYGLGNSDSEGEAPAAAFDVTVENNAFTHIGGSAGFFLREDGVAEGDSGLHVTGNIEFSYNVANDMLEHAEGEVTIYEKELGKVGDNKLILKESKATAVITNNQLESVTGTVDLTLADGKGEYLAFKSEGNFDCIDTTEVSGTVSVSVIREKQVAKVGQIGVFINGDGETGITAEIDKNKLGNMEGTIGFKIQRNGEDFFGGKVGGTYTAEDGTINGEAEIKLLNDLELPEGSKIFTLKKGSGGSVSVDNNQLTSLEGDIKVGIAPPKLDGEDGNSNEIILEAFGKVNVAKAEIETFTATASTTGAIEIVKDLTIDKLSGSATIENNKLNDIEGSAAISYKKNGFSITGRADAFKWHKNENGGPDGFMFVGGLDISGFGGKVTGSATVEYDALTKQNAAPKLTNCELTFKINEWLGGKVGLRFDNDGWDDPVIYGTMSVTNATLIDGRQLLGYDNPKLFEASVSPIPLVEFGAGLGLGFSVDLEPVTFSAELELQDFHLADITNQKAVPNFNTNMELHSGISAKASLIPYLKANVGVSGIIEAGIKLKGIASVNATAAADFTGTLEGTDEGLGGEVGIGFEVTGGASLSLVPSLYASVLNSKEAEANLAEFTMDLGEIFNFKWGKTFGFGTKAGQVSDTSDVPKLNAESQVQANVEGDETATQEYAPTAAASDKEDAPPIPDAKSIGDESGADKEKDAGGDNKFANTIENAQKVATAVSNIAEIVSFITNLITMGATLGPAGILVYVLVKLITEPSKFTQLPQKLQEIKEGIEAIKDLIADNKDVIMQAMPEWIRKLLDVIDIIRNPRDHLPLIVEGLYKKVDALGSPKADIVRPLVDFVAGEADKICEIYAKFEEGGAANIVSAIFDILGFGLSSLVDLCRAIKQMWSVFSNLVRQGIKENRIYATLAGNYSFIIPGLFEDKGWNPAKAAGVGILTCLV